VARIVAYAAAKVMADESADPVTAAAATACGAVAELCGKIDDAEWELTVTKA
jgi:hypothetical protein